MTAALVQATEVSRAMNAARFCESLSVSQAELPPLNLARVDLVSLRLVACCVETGSLSRACREIHLSLSGASHRLGSLEDALGVRLFVRCRRGLEPTRAGRLVAQQAGRIIGLLDELQVALAVREPSEGRSRALGPLRAARLAQ